MSRKLEYTIVDGIRCYSPDVATSYSDYPDNGFDLTQEYSTSSFWVRSRSRLFKYLVEKYLPKAEKVKFLEVGCGTGDFLRQLVGNSRLEITGSEIYLKGLQYAQKNLPQVSFVQFDVTQGPIDDQFDMVVSFDVLEHVEEDVQALANIHNMLNTNGVVIISVPQHMFMWSELDVLVKHKRRYSRRELCEKLTSTGYEVTYATSFVFTLFPIMCLSRLLERKRSTTTSDEAELEKRVHFSGFSNFVLNAFMRLDELMIRLGLSLPFGGTLVVVASKA